MASTKLIAVLGATGNQGGSVVNTFLKEPGWRIRAITRNVLSPKAQALEARGMEVVQANMDSPTTLEVAFKDANVIFAVSDFWGLYADPTSKDKAEPGQPLNVWVANHETQQLKNAIDAAAKVQTLERFVFSSLSNATKWSKGLYTHVYHFDSKALAVEYGRQKHPELWEKTSVFQAGYFLSNFVGNPITQPTKNKDGIVQFVSNLDPDVKLPFIAAEEDSGPFVKALVVESAGKNVIAYREWTTLREVAKAFTEATGSEAETVMLPKGQHTTPHPPDLELEFHDNWAYWNEFGYEGRDDPTVIHPKDLNSPPKLESVLGYLKKQDWSKVFTS
ncbi:Fc.00g074150.m01.CDS01 [Cosmosporella sp. VM-42]